MSDHHMTAQTALKKFGEGIDCSQVVFGYAAEKLGFDKDTALKISSVFGGGMWNGETCGCVTGALMALGLKYGHCKPNDEATKKIVLEKKAEFEKKFIEKNQTLICKNILGHNLANPKEMEIIIQKKLLTELCPYVVCDACDILDEIMF